MNACPNTHRMLANFCPELTITTLPSSMETPGTM
jgi:hypothetical protein